MHFRTHRLSTFEERSRLMNRVAAILQDRSREFAELITSEMGKPIREAEAEVKKCAWVCEFYAEHAEKFLQARKVETEAEESRVIYQALGPLLAIMPWNFPFWQVFRFAAPALMAGNTAAFKTCIQCAGMCRGH